MDQRAKRHASAVAKAKRRSPQGGVCRAVLTLPLVAPLARPLPSSFRPEAVEALRLHKVVRAVRCTPC